MVKTQPYSWIVHDRSCSYFNDELIQISNAFQYVDFCEKNDHSLFNISSRQMKEIQWILLFLFNIILFQFQFIE